MIGSLFTSAAGMRTLLEQQDVIANNLANASTPGFKRSSAGFLALVNQAQTITNPTTPAPPSVRSVVPTLIVHTDVRPGTMTDTKDPTDLAIDGEGSFVVSTPGGERLTRSGSFTLNDTGQLVTREGYPVLGEGGPIQVSGTNWTVDTSGNVSVDKTIVGKLRIEGSQQPGRIIQGSLEDSNVNVVQEMVSMITGLRAYEANQKAVQAIDQTLDKAINQMGRTA
ncbi:MAG TPA: flagellar hook-basal body protein [Armatimonadota bacterium]|nr:flagellar hook-basal body protein [Armatimonadota bacterium]